MEEPKTCRIVSPGSFEAEQHFYPRVLNANLHPMVKMFLALGNQRIARRYCHLHPGANYDKLIELFSYTPAHFFWAGSDLFSVTNEKAQRQMIVIETNSCPSGQKSMPCDDAEESNGFYALIRHSLLYVLEHMVQISGRLAVVYDKNKMEATGYAAAMADVCKEDVLLAEYHMEDQNPPVRWQDEVMYVRDENHDWVPVRAAFRYVTQKPWNRFPVNSKTFLLNPIIACLAGGRNKLVASKAYEFLNLELHSYGLEIRTPDTITDVSVCEIPLYLRSMGMKAVVKIPYSNAGQGVFTITNEKELDDFMSMNHGYDKFIVQSLVGNYGWSTISRTGTYFHLGTVPNRKNESYVCDLRMMIGGSDQGFVPIAVYARRAKTPLAETLENSTASWDMLGTNLSIKTEKGWDSDTSRLLLMDNKDFNRLGIGLDDLIDGYVQTVLSAVAIDKMCKKLVDPNSGFKFSLFSSLDQDHALLEELKMANRFP